MLNSFPRFADDTTTTAGGLCCTAVVSPRPRDLPASARVVRQQANVPRHPRLPAQLPSSLFQEAHSLSPCFSSSGLLRNASDKKEMEMYVRDTYTRHVHKVHGKQEQRIWITGSQVSITRLCSEEAYPVSPHEALFTYSTKHTTSSGNGGGGSGDSVVPPTPVFLASRPSPPKKHCHTCLS